MAKMPTRQEMATNYELWSEYVDLEGIYTEEEFSSMTVEEKIEIIRRVYSPEEDRET